MKKDNPPSFYTFVKDDGQYRRKLYQTRHVISGHTDSAYINLGMIGRIYDNDIDKIVETANEIADGVKAEFPDFIQSVFNIPTDNVPIIDTERETVSDKSYFLTKSRYIMHVVDDEGKRVDKNKIVGLEIRKTDTPKVIQKFLTDIVSMIMDGKEYQEVMNYIEEFKEYYMTLSVFDVGRPMSVKVLGEYERQFNETGSMKSFPYHVRGALFYNKHCSSEHRKILSGDKIRICYIKHPESNYIAVPVDGTHFPDIVNEVVVDWESQWQTVWKKAQNYLRPMNWHEEGVKEETNYNLFGVQ